jgi:anti-sigma regulatory factor (Ser/Thr protein kinase)
MAEKLAEIRFPSRAEQLPAVREQLRSIVGHYEIPGDESHCVVVAVNEACMNIIQHAYGDGACGDIILEVYDDKQELEFRLTDFAPTVDKFRIKARDVNTVRPGGLGVHIIHEVMDEVAFPDPPRGAGNVLVMKKRYRSRL